MTVQNIGTSEGTIVRYQSYFCISESIANLRSDADFVLLEGGGNDAWYGTQVIPLGTLSSGYSATLDTTTFAGAFENMLKSAIARFQNAKIGYIFPHKCIANFDSPNGAYRNMAISALEKWGIPYCDLNVSVPPLGYIDSLKSTYTAGDGIHPNEAGYRTFYVPKIVAFMQTMLTDKSLINKTVTANGTYIASDDDADGYDSVTVNVSGSGSSKNVQTEQSTSRRNNTALGSVTSLTCEVAGTYDVYWTCTRSSTSGTWGSQLYINGTAYGTENTVFSNNVQNNHLSGVQIPANATVAVYGRSRSGYYIYVPQLTIQQTA
jgi:lysophospholipase L1-like esterase